MGYCSGETRLCPRDGQQCHLHSGGDCYKRSKPKQEVKVMPKTTVVHECCQAKGSTVVHAVKSKASGGRVQTVCNQHSPSSHWNTVDHLHHYPLVNKPVTCKRCLATLGETALQVVDTNEPVSVTVANLNKYQPVTVILTVNDEETFKQMKAGLYDSSNVTKLIKEELNK